MWNIVLTVVTEVKDVLWSELMERCRTPPRCRSPSITRRSNEPRQYYHILLSLSLVIADLFCFSVTLHLKHLQHYSSHVRVNAVRTLIH